MKNPTIALIGAACAALSAENVGDDARRTPIGSVISGDTRSADSYLKRVSDENRSLDRDTWRPISNEDL